MDNLLVRHVSRNQERCTLIPWQFPWLWGDSPGVPCHAQHILWEQPAPPGSGEMCSPTPLECWGLHLFSNQGKTQGKVHGTCSQVPLFPFPPKIKSRTVTSYILSHPPELFSEVKNSKMGNLWKYNCFLYTAAHGSLEKVTEQSQGIPMCRVFTPGVNRTDFLGQDRQTLIHWMAESACDLKKTILPSMTSSKQSRGVWHPPELVPVQIRETQTPITSLLHLGEDPSTPPPLLQPFGTPKSVYLGNE